MSPLDKNWPALRFHCLSKMDEELKRIFYLWKVGIQVTVGVSMCLYVPWFIFYTHSTALATPDFPLWHWFPTFHCISVTPNGPFIHASHCNYQCPLHSSPTYLQYFLSPRIPPGLNTQPSNGSGATLTHFPSLKWKRGFCQSSCSKLSIAGVYLGHLFPIYDCSSEGYLFELVWTLLNWFNAHNLFYTNSIYCIFVKK